MGVAETTLIYLTIGLALSIAGPGHRNMDAEPTLGTRVLWMGLWPFFAPTLLGGREAGGPAQGPVTVGTLLESLRSLGDRLPLGVLEEHEAKILAVKDGLVSIRRQQEELGVLLSLPELNLREAEATLKALRGRGLKDEDPRIRSVLGRLDTIQELETMGERLDGALEMATLSMEHLGGQIRLLRFTDAPELELASLISDITLSVDSLTRSLDV